MSATALAVEKPFDHPLSAEMIFLTGGTGGNCESCAWIIAEGTITDTTPKLFERFLSKQKAEGGFPSYIHLHSPGGNLLASLKLGELIRENKLNAKVAKTIGTLNTTLEHVTEGETTAYLAVGECSSACAYAFLGGVSRFAVSSHYGLSEGQPKGRLGVHQFYSEAALKDVEQKAFSALDISANQLVTALLLEYTTRMGADAQLVALASSTPPWKMYYLKDSELVATGVESAERTATAKLDVIGRSSAAVVIEYQIPSAAVRTTLFCKRGKLKMWVMLKTSYQNTLESITEWSLYDDWTMSMSDRAVPIKKESVGVSTDGFTTEVVFQLGDKPIEEYANMNSFAFNSSSSRYASEAAADLSFVLPTQFTGLQLLPRACLR